MSNCLKCGKPLAELNKGQYCYVCQARRDYQTMLESVGEDSASKLRRQLRQEEAK